MAAPAEESSRATAMNLGWLIPTPASIPRSEAWRVVRSTAPSAGEKARPVTRSTVRILLVRLAGEGGIHDPTEGQDVVEGRAELRGTQLPCQERDLERVRFGVLCLLEPVCLQDVGIERVPTLRGRLVDGLDVVALGSPFQGQHHQEPRQRRMGEDGARECRHFGLLVVEVATKPIAAGLLEDSFRPSQQLLVLELLVAEPEQHAQPGAVVMPACLSDVAQVGWSELLEVAEQVRVAEGATVIQEELLFLVQEVEGLHAHPRRRHQGPRRVELPAAEHPVHGPGDTFRRGDDRGVAQFPAEPILLHPRPPRLPASGQPLGRLLPCLRARCRNGCGGAATSSDSSRRRMSIRRVSLWSTVGSCRRLFVKSNT